MFGNYKPAYAINRAIGHSKNTIEGSAPNSASFFRSIVKIFDCTEATKDPIPCLNMPQSVGIKWCAGLYSIYSYGDSQATFTNWNMGKRRGFPIARQLSAGTENIKVNANVIYDSSGVADINKQKIHSDGHIWQNRCRKPEIFYSNARTMRRVELVSGKFESGSGQLRLFRCGAPQGQGEGGNGDCRKRGERPIVLVNERPLAQQEDGDVNTTRNSLMQIGLFILAVIAFVVGCTLLIRR
jgi:hypothetical protein